jgi:hypothetical protein
LVLAIIGLVSSLVPLTGFLATILGVLAVVFGLLGLGRVQRRIATNRALTIVGTVLGLIAMLIGIIGMVIVFKATAQLGRDLAGIGTQPGVSSSAMPAPEADPSVTDMTVTAPGSFSWENGLIVDVSAPTATRFSSSACCATGGKGVAFTVRVVNGSDQVIQPYMLLTSLTADGVAAEQVFDSAKGYTGTPTNSIPPGRELTFPVAFDTAGGDLLFEIGGFSYTSAFFTASL